MEILRKQNNETLKVLRVAASQRYGINYNELAKKAKEKFGIRLEKEEIVESARKLNDFGMLSSFSINGEYMGIKNLYRKHILDLLKTK